METQNNHGENGSQNHNVNTKAPGDHTVLAALSYIGPLVIVAYVTGKDNDFVKFHAKQGMVLFGIEVIVWVFMSMFYSIIMLITLVQVATFILSIIGIVNVVQGHKKELPLIGQFAKNINF